jgi:hypothetical protein
MNFKDIDKQSRIITEWNEKEHSDFFRFNKIGDKITGLLIQRTVSTRYGFGLYTLRVKGKQICFHGSVQLDSLMKRVNLAEFIEVKLVDIQKMPKGDMKIFIVCVAQSMNGGKRSQLIGV